MDKKYENILKISIKYLIEGLAMVLVAFYIPLLYKSSLRKPTFNEVVYLALTA